MNRLLGLLLAINVGVFAAGMALQYWPQPVRAPVVFNADKIRLLGIAGIPAPRIAAASLESKNPEPELEPDATTEPGVPPVESDSVEAGAKPAPDKPVAESRPQCFSWSRLDADTLNAIQTHLKRSGIGVDAYDVELEKKLGWWVFMPPVETQADLRANVDEVRSLGVTDFAPVRSGSMQNALSLGAFAKLAQARKRAAELSKLGLSAVKFGPRPESGVARLVFSSQVPDKALHALESGWPKGLKPARCAQP
ncbi:MAG: hypothetical protein B7Y41_11510 [Hydrogenophilales bacterium 28-61-23]|nr:MAG: hypothetical protein B7Y41_11510 [Hydrogenophilales bacterium 28-61-23]